MHSKTSIFNLALGALLLQRRIVDADTETNNEAKVLQTHFDTAFSSALKDMDLDSTSSQVTLELVEENPNNHWLYAYKYPHDCAFFRRIQSHVIMDNRATHIPRLVRNHNGQKVIFTNQEEAVAEYISTDVPISSLSSSAVLAIAYKLATLSTPLITGKGAQALVKGLQEKYIVAKTEAQEQDRNENFNFTDAQVDSEFVAARTE